MNPVGAKNPYVPVFSKPTGEPRLTGIACEDDTKEPWIYFHLTDGRSYRCMPDILALLTGLVIDFDELDHGRIPAACWDIPVDAIRRSMQRFVHPDARKHGWVTS